MALTKTEPKTTDVTSEVVEQPASGTKAGLFETVEQTEAGSSPTTTADDGDVGASNDKDAAAALMDEQAKAQANAQAQRALQVRAQSALQLRRDTMVVALQNVIPSDDLESMGIGVFPRITVAPGTFMEDKTKNLGDQVVLELMSWNFIWLVTTGEQNNTEANKLIRTSYDGVNLKDAGGTITDYVKQLKVDGYNKAECKKYVELYGSMISNRKGGEIPTEDRKLVQVSVSPQSVGQWGLYQLERAMAKGKGIDDTAVICLDADTKTSGPNTYGIIRFTVPKKTA